MDDFFQNTGRVEAQDLVAYGVLGQRQVVSLPVRFGDRHLGLVRVRPLQGDQVQFTWAGGSGGQVEQILNVHQFTARDRRHTCVRCPSCGRFRKKLFLVSRASTLFCQMPEPFSFVCEHCANPPKRDQKSRRQRRRRSPHHHHHRRRQASTSPPGGVRIIEINP